MRRTSRVLTALAVFSSQSIFASDLDIQIGDVVSPGFQMKQVTAKLTAQGELEAGIGELNALGKTFRRVKLKCGKFELDRIRVRCERGVLNRDIPVRFEYDFSSGSTEVELIPERGEVWRVSGQYKKHDWRFKLTVSEGSISRFADWLPQPRISSGRMSGVATIVGQGVEAKSVTGEFALARVAFSDEGGLHAGDKVGAKVTFGALHAKSKWDWKLDFLWNAGEVFWQPLYLTGKGHRLVARGDVADKSYEISEALLTLQGVGDFAFVGRARDGKITEAGIAVSDMPLESLYEVVLKPFLEKTALNDLRTAGALDFALRYANSEIVEIDVNLEHVSLEDRKRRFAIFGVDAKVPWKRYAMTSADIRLDGGEIFNVPLGKAQLPLTMNGFAFSAPALEIPVLDGKLKLNDFAGREENDAWRWSFSGALAPIAMDGLTRALDVTTMRGTLSGEIPLVKYERSTISVEGALLLKVFDGTIIIKDLTLYEPLGIAPRLTANVDMKRLDLDLVTRAFSFGNITGRIDVAMNDFELVNWKPVKFDFALRSSEGRYPKKISQTAVENISALGGGSAAAAIQRSVLRFFEQFGYSRIGWSCSLRDGVCEMGGIEPAQSGYIIVEGGGVPQITVLGYNRRVNWQELLARLQRVTSSKPVVR